MTKRINDNHANQFAAIIGVAILVNLGCYCLPNSILGIQIKTVDLLSDIRMHSTAKDSRGWENEEKNRLADSNEDSALGIHHEEKAMKDNEAEMRITCQAKNERGIATVIPTPNQSAQTVKSADISSTQNQTVQSADISSTQIEDFSTDRSGLHRFFTALNNINELDRPVRVAFVGDSFIEGDILVADFRAMMQAHYGGRGVGFLPITSVVAQYRPTIKQSADGWKNYSIISNKSKKYIISGVQFEPSTKNASFKFQMVDFRPGLEEVSTLKIIYAKNEQTELILKDDNQTYNFILPQSDVVTQFELSGQFSKGTLQFNNAQGLSAIGVAFEDNHGISVDNFALRGNSGIVMSALDSESCRQLQEIRPYDLIILQYGLNVASDSVRDYSWYRNQMIPVVTHIQHCFPEADVLILSVSDRSRNVGGSYSTMPAVMSLLRAQRQIAQSAEVTFWSVFDAMGGENGMVNYVNKNWASKDYTHLNFNGGREIANVLFKALMAEKSIFDNLEKYDNHDASDENEIFNEHELLNENELLDEH